MRQPGKHIFVEVMPLHKSHAATLVQDALSGTMYVRKLINQCEAAVYSAIAAAPHPNLVGILQVSKQPSGHTLVIEQFINGVTLESYLHEKGRLPAAEALHIAAQLTAAMQHLHTLPRPVIHRDIKLSNVFRAENGTILLCDYHTARFHNAHLDRDTVPLGTEGYAAPEQFGFSQSDARTDIYAFGILLNLLLTGLHPSKQLAEGELRPIIEKCVAFSPENRFANVSELRKAMGFEVTKRPYKRKEGKRRILKRTLLTFGASIACILLLWGSVFLYRYSPLYWSLRSQEQNTPSAAQASLPPTAPASTGVPSSAFPLGGFEITIGDTPEWGRVADVYYDHGGKDVFSLPVTIHNTGEEPLRFSSLTIVQYGPEDTRLKDISLYFEEYIGWVFEIAPGETATGNIYFLYEGAGEYRMVLKTGSASKKISIVLE